MLQRVTGLKLRIKRDNMNMIILTVKKGTIPSEIKTTNYDLSQTIA